MLRSFTAPSTATAFRPSTAASPWALHPLLAADVLSVASRVASDASSVWSCEVVWRLWFGVIEVLQDQVV
jgi:hypothetical protein